MSQKVECKACGRDQERSKTLIGIGSGDFICNECVELFTLILAREQPIKDEKPEVLHAESFVRAMTEEIIGQFGPARGREIIVKIKENYNRRLAR